MKISRAALALAFCLTMIFSCSRDNFSKTVPGIWEWTGDRCDGAGRCAKEIITDLDGRIEFTADGLFKGRTARNNYEIRRNKIYLSSGKNSRESLFAEITWVRGGTMLLKEGDTVKRYARVSPSR